MVHDQGQGWEDDWGEPDNAASWFDNVPSNEPAPVVAIADNNEIVENQNNAELQQNLQTKEAECSELKSERDALINIQSTLQAQIEELQHSLETKEKEYSELQSEHVDLQAQVERINQSMEINLEGLQLQISQLVEEKSNMELQLKELQASESKVQEIQAQTIPIQTHQHVQCQPETIEKMTETQHSQIVKEETVEVESQPNKSIDISLRPETQDESLQSPPPNLFTWDNFIDPLTSQQTNDFFSQDSFPISEPSQQQASDIFSQQSFQVSDSFNIQESFGVLEEQQQQQQPDSFDIQKSFEPVEQQQNLESETEILRKQKVDLENQMLSMETNLEGLKSHIDSLVQEKSNLELQLSQLQASEVNVQELQAQIDQHINEKSNMELQMSQLKASEANVFELKAQIDQHVQEKLNMEFQLSQLQFSDPNVQEIQASGSNINALQDQINQLVQEKSNLEFQLSQCQSSEIKVKELQDQISCLVEEKSNMELQMLNSTDLLHSLEAKNFECSNLISEKDSLVEQIHQLPSMDAFESLRKVNKEISESNNNLKQKLEELHSNEEYKKLEQLNLELKQKLASIAESQNEAYELQIQDLNKQISNLQIQLSDIETSKAAATSEVSNVALEVTAPSETEPIEDKPDKHENNMLGISQPVEKGVSASSYFDTIGTTEISDNDNPFLETSGVFETQVQEQSNIAVSAAFAETSEENSTAITIEWYKNQLEQYQQAISDWQAWSQSHLQENASLQESLTYYTNVYNALVEEHNKGSDNNEIASLRASVKAKEIEVDDLIETVDRLKAEKTDLEHEITELRTTNQDLKSEEDQPQFDFAMLEETQQSLDEHMDKLAKATEELDAKNNQIQTILFDKQEAEKQLLQLQNDLIEKKHELDQVKENKNKEILENQQDLENKDKEIVELKDEISLLNTKQVQFEEDINLKQEEMEFQMSQLKASEVNIVELQAQIDQHVQEKSNMVLQLNQLQNSEPSVQEFEASGSNVNELHDQINQLIQEKLNLEFQLSQCQSSESKVQEFQQELENKNKEIVELKNEISQLNSKEIQNEEEINVKQAEIENLAAESNNKCSNEDIEKLKAEIEQQKSVLNEWNNWGQAKADEYNQLLSAYNQYVESYNKLSEEITDLKTANENLNEIFTTTQTSLQEKTTELNEKNAEIERLKQCDTNNPVISAFDDSLTEKSGWGAPEDEIILGQSNPDDNAVLELEAEISELKQKLRSSEEDKIALNEEINAAKVKHGKLTLKVKQLTKELQTRKSMSPDSGGTDSLDKAIQDELNERATKAEKSLKEFQQQYNDLNKEKTKLLERIDTLEGGNSRFLDLKEAQDQEVEHLKIVLKDLQSKVNGFEWELSEKDSLIQDLEEELNVAKQIGAAGNEEGSDQIQLKLETNNLRRYVVLYTYVCTLVLLKIYR